LQICRLSIKNFRGIQESTLVLPKHAVLLGDNNIGKTTVLEGIDLVLGPDRLNRTPPIDEHDFYQGKYIANAQASGLASTTPDRLSWLATVYRKRPGNTPFRREACVVKWPDE
jgi:predicted ATP-dependent endonuclease of OLD family